MKSDTLFWFTSLSSHSWTPLSLFLSLSFRPHLLHEKKEKLSPPPLLSLSAFHPVRLYFTPLPVVSCYLSFPHCRHCRSDLELPSVVSMLSHDLVDETKERLACEFKRGYQIVKHFCLCFCISFHVKSQKLGNFIDFILFYGVCIFLNTSMRDHAAFFGFCFIVNIEPKYLKNKKTNSLFSSRQHIFIENLATAITKSKWIQLTIILVNDYSDD